MKRVSFSIVHALVNNRHVPDMYQVWVETITTAPNLVTVLDVREERLPADRGVTMTEARALVAQLEGTADNAPLRAAHDALDYLRGQLSQWSSREDLALVEGFACHLSNRVAGTPCHPACVVCGDQD